jgi:hypothetical protein
MNTFSSYIEGSTVDNAIALMRDACRLIQLVNGEGLEVLRAAIHAPTYESYQFCWVRAAYENFQCCPETVAFYGELMLSEVGEQFSESRERLWPDIVEVATWILKQSSVTQSLLHRSEEHGKNIASLEVEFAGRFEVDRFGNADIRDLMWLKADKVREEIRGMEAIFDIEMPGWRAEHTETSDGEVIWPLIAIEDED